MLLKSLLLLAGARGVLAKCKCTPLDDCWPAESRWASLNSTVERKLIQNQPLAKSCYPGPGYSAKECQQVASNWKNEFWIPESPIGYSYPLVDTCPPINASVSAYPSCDLGTSPAYSINATKAHEVAAGILFAKENNVRLVIKNTGHDISQRSQRYGSLSVWIRNIRNGLHFQKSFQYSEGSCHASWNGSAITIGGGYVWKDVYDFATKHRHVVVGGGDPTVGCIGGFLQGAGHGSLSHEFGLATDQVLEYKVVLASGDTVIANGCQNFDLFTALRGGGVGTYGVVISATVKTHPTRPTLYHDLTVVSLNHNSSAIFEAVARMASKYPEIVDEGFAGTASLSKKYGPWVYNAPFIKFLANDSIEAINHAKNIMQREIIHDLLNGNGTHYLVTSKWSTHPSWAAWYASTHHTSAGNNHPLMASRFFKRDHLSGRKQKLLELLQILTNEIGTAKEVQVKSSTVLFNIVAGGKVLTQVPHTSVNPAWRETYLLLQGIDMWPENANQEEVHRVKQEVTRRKLRSMKILAPGTGTYPNEADPYDPQWKQDWFGDRYDQLASIKQKYDPEGVFWCWRCVGNEDDRGWVVWSLVSSKLKPHFTRSICTQ